MKKKMAILLVVGVVAVGMFAGCGNSAKDQTETTTQEDIGMPNPMVEIKDDKDFSDKLGIDINVDKLTGTNKLMFIISDEIAEVKWTVTDSDNKTTDITLRATKADMTGIELSGIYDSTMQDNGEENFSGVVFHKYYSPQENTAFIYETKANGVTYTVSYFGEIKDDLLNSVLNTVCNACGLK